MFTQITFPWILLKKFTAALIILSMLYPDVSKAMNTENKDEKQVISIQRKENEIENSSRGIKQDFVISEKQENNEIPPSSQLISTNLLSSVSSDKKNENTSGNSPEHHGSSDSLEDSLSPRNKTGTSSDEEKTNTLSLNQNSNTPNTTSDEKSSSLESSPPKKFLIQNKDKRDDDDDIIIEEDTSSEEIDVEGDKIKKTTSIYVEKIVNLLTDNRQNSSSHPSQNPILLFEKDTTDDPRKRELSQNTNSSVTSQKKEYTEKTPLLIDHKNTTQKKPFFPFSEKDTSHKELTSFPIKGSINQSENERLDFNIEENTELISQEDHKNKKNGNSDSVDNFDYTLISGIDKRGCCCNRPCWPHPDLYQLNASDLQNVIERSEEEEKKDLLQINTSDLPNVTKTVSKEKNPQLSLTLLSNEDQKLTPALFIEKLKELDFKKLSQHTKTQLNYVTREMEGPWPKWEWIKNKQWGKVKEWAKNELPGFVVGGGIGVWLSGAMIPVYASSIAYLEFTYIAFDEKPWINIMKGIGKNLPSYIIPSVIEDAVPRNVILWNKGLALLKEENISKKRIALTALVSFFPSLFEPFYLIIPGISIIKLVNSEGGNSAPYKVEILKYVWPLFTDSWASNFQTTWNLWDDYQEWKQSTTCCLLSKTLHTRIPSEEELARRDFRKKLDKVNRFLYHTASNKEIETLYKTVQGSKEEAEKQFGNLDEESLSNAQALLTLNYLLSLGDDLEQTQRYIKSWYEITADILTDFCLVTGSPARLLTLQLIISSITDLIPMPSWLRHTLNWGLAGVGWLPQTILEWKGMDSFLKQFIAQQEPDSEAIYKNAKIIGGFRVGAKAYALGQALIFTIPLVITVLQAANKWKIDPHWMIGGATFLFAEFATQVSQQWERSAQQWVSFFAKAHNVALRDKCLKKPLRTEYQRGHLIELNQKFKDRLPYLSPELLHMLKGNMNLTEEEN